MTIGLYLFSVETNGLYRLSLSLRPAAGVGEANKRPGIQTEQRGNLGDTHSRPIHSRFLHHRIRQPIPQRHRLIPAPSHPALARLRPLPQRRPSPSLSVSVNIVENPIIRVHEIVPRHAHPQKPGMRHHNDGFLRPRIQLFQDRLPSLENGLPRVGVEGACGGGLFGIDRVDETEVDLGEEGG